MRLSFLFGLILIAPLLAGPSLHAQQPAPLATAHSEQIGLWLARAAAAYEQGDDAAWIEALEELHRMRPHNPDFMLQLVSGYARSGQTAKAFDMMLRMQRQGMAYDWDENPDVETLRQYRLYGHLNTLMKEAGEPFGDAREFARLDGAVAMPEALAFDPRTGRLFAGTVRDGRILVFGEDSEWREFAAPASVPGLRAVFDLVVDAARGHLWVATGLTSQFRGFRTTEAGRTALLKLDLASGEKLGEYPVAPDGLPHLLGALALAEDGSIFASDSLSPFIYRLEPGAERPERFAGHPVFTGLRGLALSADGSHLYVADYELGIFLIEAGDERRMAAIGIPDELNLAGIDGLYFWNDSLIAIQNGISPQRVVRLQLDQSGTRVANIVPLLAAHPDFDTPTFGTLADRELILIASSHWDKVDGSGRPLASPLPDTPLLALRVDSEKQMMVGREVLEQLRRQVTPGTPPEGG